MQKPIKQYYYIIFQNGEGSFPQRDSKSYDKAKVQEEVDKLNRQLVEEDRYPYCCYSVGVGNEFASTCQYPKSKW